MLFKIPSSLVFTAITLSAVLTHARVLTSRQVAGCGFSGNCSLLASECLQCGYSAAICSECIEWCTTAVNVCRVLEAGTGITFRYLDTAERQIADKCLLEGAEQARQCVDFRSRNSVDAAYSTSGNDTSTTGTAGNTTSTTGTSANTTSTTGTSDTVALDTDNPPSNGNTDGGNGNDGSDGAACLTEKSLLVLEAKGISIHRLWCTTARVLSHGGIAMTPSHAVRNQVGVLTTWQEFLQQNNMTHHEEKDTVCAAVFAETKLRTLTLTAYNSEHYLSLSTQARLVSLFVFGANVYGKACSVFGAVLHLCRAAILEGTDWS